MKQPRLFEFRMGERAPETLVVTEANRDAANLLQDWRAWPSGALALVGPAGSGKTHLGLAWALETGARALDASAGPDEGAALFREAGGRLFIDSAAEGFNEGMLWRILDMARAQDGAVLMASTKPPSQWFVHLPDLRSRLSALAVARLHEPDDALMAVVLRRVCREQFIYLREDAVQYLARRLPRTFAAAHAWAAALDANLAKGAKPVTLSTAKKTLEKAMAGWTEVGDG